MISPNKIGFAVVFAVGCVSLRVPQPVPESASGLQEKVSLGEVVAIDPAGKSLTVKVADVEKVVSLDSSTAHNVGVRVGETIRLYLRRDGSVSAFGKVGRETPSPKRLCLRQGRAGDTLTDAEHRRRGQR